MGIKAFVLALLVFFPLSLMSDFNKHHHGQKNFHAFWLELASGGGKSGAVSRWELDGWMGGDDHKLWLKSEGETEKNRMEEAEFWALYSRNIAVFWDFQVGIRQDVYPRSTSYMVIGFNGLAPYLLETEAYFFVSKEGELSARLKQSVHLLITQRFGIEPYYEINAFAQDVSKLNVGKGISNGKIGLQIRYEITREWAPYLDIRYEQKFGETASIARRMEKRDNNYSLTIGVRVMF